MLEIGTTKYRFRTLSLYDVWCLWPSLLPMHEALKHGKPLAFAKHYEGALEHLCPGLTKSDDFKEGWKTFHNDALIEFYEAQDWIRIKILLDSLGEKKEGPAAPGIDAEKGERNFFTIVSAAQRRTRI